MKFKSDWGGWWFLNGGGIHGAWKRRQYSQIKEYALQLPKLAWDEQQKKIDSLEKRIKELEGRIATTSGGF